MNFYIFSINWIFRHPKTNDLHNNFLKPFENEVWLVLMGIGFVYFLCLYLTAKMEIYFNKTEIPLNTLSSIPASETGLITMAAVSQQGKSLYR